MPRVTEPSSARSADFLVSRDFLAFFGALSLFFATLEYLFPRPLPFLRLGLSNLPLLVILHRVRFRDLLLLVGIKVLGQGIINGTLSSYVFLFSLGGSMASILVMYPARRFLSKHMSLVGVGILGALASNLVQLFFSIAWIFGSSAWVIAPVFLGLGALSGVLVGILAQEFSQKSLWLARILGESPPEGTQSDRLKNGTSHPEAFSQGPAKESRSKPKRTDHLALALSPGLRFSLGLSLMVLFAMQAHWWLKLLMIAGFALAAIRAGKRLQPWFFVFFTLSVTFFHLFTPMGRVLFTLGNWAVTLGALEEGLNRALTLVGLVFISLFSVSPGLRLPGILGSLLGRSFFYFERLLETRKDLQPRELWPSVDRILARVAPHLEEVSPADSPQNSVPAASQSPEFGKSEAGKERSVPSSIVPGSIPWLDYFLLATLFLSALPGLVEWASSWLG